MRHTPPEPMRSRPTVIVSVTDWTRWLIPVRCEPQVMEPTASISTLGRLWNSMTREPAFGLRGSTRSSADMDIEGHGSVSEKLGPESTTAASGCSTGVTVTRGSWVCPGSRPGTSTARARVGPTVRPLTS